MTTETKLRSCGRAVTAKEFALIKEMTEEFWGIAAPNWPKPYASYWNGNGRGRPGE